MLRIASVVLIIVVWGAVALPVLITTKRAIPATVIASESLATSITPITSTGAAEAGLSMIGDAYSVTCTVGADAVLYKAVYRGSWAVEDTFVCNMTATRSPSRCVFPADRTNVATYNVFKASGTVSSCTAQQEHVGQPISRGTGGGGGGGGTVTSVGLTMPTGFSVANSPVTGSGTLAVTLATQAAGVALIGPTSGTAAPSFRALAVEDIPHPYKMWWSPVVRGMLNSPAYNAGGSYTVGNKWIPNCRLVVTGCRFYTAATGSRTIRCKFWGPSGAALASADVATSGAGVYTATFSSAITVAAMDVGAYHYSSIWQTDGNGWTEAGTDLASEPTPPALWAPHVQWISSYNYAENDGRPVSSYGGSYLPMEPTFGTKWPDC